MPVWQAVILGAIQGLTEFLPVSSSAHLAVMPFLTGWRDQGLEFDIAVHFGTLAAVAGYFYRDWTQIIAQGFGLNAGGDPAIARNRRLLWLLAAATLPAGALGLLFEEQAEAAGNNLYLIGAMLIGVGLFMGYADRTARQRRDLGHVNLLDSLIIGVAQAVAIIPGTSRSGVTIGAALLKGLDRPAAARFSFLLSTPVIAGAATVNFYHLYENGLAPDMRAAFAAGIITSAVVGALTIRYFLAYLRRATLRAFIAYRIVFGIIVIALAIFRA